MTHTYLGFNNYKIKLSLRDQDNKRTFYPLALNPVLRAADSCKDSTFSYCARLDGDTMGGEDQVVLMSYVGSGVYESTITFASGDWGEFRPLVYLQYDEQASKQMFEPGSNLRNPDAYEPVSSLAVADTELMVTDSTKSSSNTKYLYSALLYSGTASDEVYRIIHNNCAEVRINGERVYMSDSEDCEQAITQSFYFNLTYSAGQRHYFELWYTQVTPNSNFDVQVFDNDAGSYTTLTAGAIYRPLSFSDSTEITIRYGNEPFKGYIRACGGLITGFTIVSLLIGWMADIQFNKKIFGMYSFIHFMQFMVITPLIGIVIGHNLENFYDFMDFFLYNFEFLGKGVVFTDSNPETGPNTSFFQNTRYYQLIGLQSGSALYNIGQQVFVICMIALAYLIVNWASYIVSEHKEDNKVKKFIKWVYELFHWAILIRCVILFYTFTFLAAFTEMVNSNEEADHGDSYTFAFFLWLFCLILAFCTLIHYGVTTNEKRRETAKRWEEFFRGNKPSNAARLWPIVFIARIIFTVTITAAMEHEGRYGELSILFVFNIFYFVFVVGLRPFTEWVDTTLEAFNSFMYGIFLVALYGLDKRDGWDEGVDNTYIAFMVLQSFVNCLLIAGKIDFLNFK